MDTIFVENKILNSLLKSIDQNQRYNISWIRTMWIFSNSFFKSIIYFSDNLQLKYLE